MKNTPLPLSRGEPNPSNHTVKKRLPGIRTTSGTLAGAVDFRLQT
jgi:hypothetical protein